MSSWRHNETREGGGEIITQPLRLEPKAGKSGQTGDTWAAGIKFVFAFPDVLNVTIGET